MSPDSERPDPDTDLLDVRAETWEAYARLFAYPPPEAGDWLIRCRERVAARSEPAAEELASFEEFLRYSTPGERNETYSRAFDLNALFQPYVGYHLFGETYRRSRFMVRLKEHYREDDFSPGGELPDHLEVVLRFLPECEHPEFRRELIRVGLVPALGSMLDVEDALPEGMQGPGKESSTSNGFPSPGGADSSGNERMPAAGPSPGPAGLGARVSERKPPASGEPKTSGISTPGGSSSASGDRNPGDGAPGMRTGTAFCRTGCTSLKGVSQMETERSEEQREEEKAESPYRSILTSLSLLLGGARTDPENRPGPGAGSSG